MNVNKFVAFLPSYPKVRENSLKGCQSYLLTSGSDEVLFSGKGSTLDERLYKAAEKGDLATVKKLLDNGMNVNTPNFDDFMPTHAALQNGHVDVVKLLAEEGAALDTLGRFRYSLAHEAVILGDLELLNWLIASGMPIDKRDVNGRLPIDVVSEFNNNPDDPIIKLLKNPEQAKRVMKVEPKVIGMRDSALHDACDEGDLEKVKQLISQGAEVNCLDHLDSLPIHNAAYEGHVDVVKELIRAGSIVDFPDVFGNRPIDLARRNKSSEAMRVVFEDTEHIRDEGFNSEDTAIDLDLIQAMRDRELDTIRQILEKTTDIDISTLVNEKGRTVLHELSKIDDKFLIEKIAIACCTESNGSVINATDSNGNTPLISSAARGNLLVVKMLLETDADLSVKNKFGNTALDMSKINGHDEVTKFLLDYQND